MHLYSIQIFCLFPEINIFAYFDVKSKQTKLWASAWRHLLALFISFILVTNFHIKSCISRTFIISKIVHFWKGKHAVRQCQLFPYSLDMLLVIPGSIVRLMTRRFVDQIESPYEFLRFDFGKFQSPPQIWIWWRLFGRHFFDALTPMWHPSAPIPSPMWCETVARRHPLRDKQSWSFNQKY